MTLFSQEIIRVLEYGLIAEQTMGATIDSNKITPFSPLCRFFKTEKPSKVKYEHYHQQQ